jgi:hypothetical protein
LLCIPWFLVRYAYLDSLNHHLKSLLSSQPLSFMLEAVKFCSARLF